MFHRGAASGGARLFQFGIGGEPGLFDFGDLGHQFSPVARVLRGALGVIAIEAWCRQRLVDALQKVAEFPELSVQRLDPLADGTDRQTRLRYDLF